MEAYGKIFVVVAVLSIILVGIYVYLFFIDRRISKIEKEVREKLTERKS
jgi:CcmD family protein